MLQLASDPERRGLGARPIALLAVFALSGFTGLIYESIWSHYLKLFLGHAAYAQTLVLAIFMGGMAIGAAAVGRWSTKLARPVLAYALVELLIGALALMFDREFQALLHWSFDSVLPQLGSTGAVQGFKWSAGALLILPQSILLGMTYPLISGGLTRASPARSGELLALLYFANCIGAAAGVLTSGFYLIGRLGLPGTLLTAGALNLLVALAAWLLSRGTAVPPVRTASEAAQLTTRSPRLLAIAALATGLASFFYEIAWIRMLSLALGSSTHSFELMLAAFIFGLAAGGWWIRRRIDHIEDPMRFLARILLATSVLAALTVAAYHHSFDVIAWAKSAFSPTESGYLGFNLVAQTLAMGIMVPVTFFAGTTLPLITHISMRSGAGERAVGTIYALNTAGCIAGVMLAIHVLMPAVGTKGTVVSGALVTFALALAVARSPAPSSRRTWLSLAATAAAAAVIAWVAVGVTPDPRRLVSSVYRTGSASLPAGSTVTYLRDGKTATISLVEMGGTTVIATNGKPDAAIQMAGGPPAPDEITMILAATLPLAMHPSARRIANIGIGSGLTSAVLLRSPAVAELTSIEIEPFMVEAARQAYRSRTAPLYDDPRSRIAIEDAKTYFASHPSRFDVIISEPSNPWVSGVSTLFSDEFYQQVTRYLADDGLLVQWLQIYETDLDVVVSILKALSANFADYQLYNVDDSNMLVIASPQRRLGDPAASIFQVDGLRPELERAGLTGLEDLTSRRIGNKALLDAFLRAQPVPTNSDYFPFVDQNAAKYRFMNRNALPLVELGMLPVPLLELAVPQWTTLTPAPPAKFSRGHREVLVSRAQLLSSGIARGNLDALPPAVAAVAAGLDVSPADCRSAGLRRAWVRSVTEVSSETSAMLPYGDVAAMWDRIHASGCYVSATAEQRAWPDFLHAVARRDRTAIEQIGRRLAAGPVFHPDADDAGLFVTAVGAAMRGAGRCDDAAAFVASAVRAFGPAPRYALALRILATPCQAG